MTWERRLPPSPFWPMPDHDRSDQRPVDRLYLLAIIGYALLAAAFIAYFVWWMMA